MSDRLVTLFTQLPFLIIFVFALRNYLSSRTRPNLDSLLLFGDIAIILLASEGATLSGFKLPDLASDLEIILLLALPYLQLRWLENFVAVSITQRVIAVGGLALLAVAIFIAPQQLPRELTIP